MKFAIVLPVYNVERYLPQCIESIQSQNHKDFLVFAVNDGSTDHSGEILDQTAAKDSRFIVIHKSNQGVAHARNSALALLEKHQVDQVCFVDADDYLSESYLSDFGKALSQTGCEYAVCGVCKVDKSGYIDEGEYGTECINIQQESIFDQFFGVDGWKYPSLLTTRFLLNRTFSLKLLKGIRFNPDYHTSEDQDYLFRVMTTIKKGVCFEKQNYFYRLRKSSLTNTLISPKDEFLLYLNAIQGITFSEKSALHVYKSVLNLWWLLVKFAYKNNDPELIKLCRDSEEVLRNHIPRKQLTYQHLKRFAIHKLPKIALRKILDLKKETKNQFSEEFFD